MERKHRSESCPYQEQPNLRKFRISKSGRPLSLRNGDYIWHPVAGQQKATVTHDVMKYYHRQYHKVNRNQKKMKNIENRQPGDVKINRRTL